VYLFYLTGWKNRTSDAKVFYEDNPIIDLSIIPSITHMLKKFDIKFLKNTLKIPTDHDMIVMHEKESVFTPQKEANMITLYFIRTDNLFEVVYKKQEDFLELRDYTCEKTKVVLSEFKIELVKEVLTKDQKNKRSFFDFMESQQSSKTRLTTAFWVKENMNFKIPDKSESAFLDQLPHPVIAQWFKLALTNDLEDAHNKIREFTEKTLRVLKIA
jgi:hypothetical protein